jgi:hypothetical protein
MEVSSSAHRKCKLPIMIACLDRYPGFLPQGLIADEASQVRSCFNRLDTRLASQAPVTQASGQAPLPRIDEGTKDQPESCGSERNCQYSLEDFLDVEEAGSPQRAARVTGVAGPGTSRPISHDVGLHWKLLDAAQKVNNNMRELVPRPDSRLWSASLGVSLIRTQKDGLGHTTTGARHVLSIGLCKAKRANGVTPALG